MRTISSPKNDFPYPITGYVWLFCPVDIPESLVFWILPPQIIFQAPVRCPETHTNRAEFWSKNPPTHLTIPVGDGETCSGLGFPTTTTINPFSHTDTRTIPGIHYPNAAVVSVWLYSYLAPGDQFSGVKSGCRNGGEIFSFDYCRL